MITQPEILVLLRLLTAHLLADFIFQPLKWIEGRRKDSIRSPYFYYHITIVGALTYILLWDWSEFLLPLFIMVTHFLIDWWKSARPREVFYFITDQIAHLFVILLGWIAYTETALVANEMVTKLFSFPSFWIVVLSYIMVIWPSGYLVANITGRWQQELESSEENRFYGLTDAGMWIGWVERFIILTFVLLNQYSGIGFLIAAKSIFRFSGRLEGDRVRREAEYILIGTLLSFSMAIITGIWAHSMMAYL